MTYKSKRTIASMISGFLLLLAYIIYIRLWGPEFSVNLSIWARFMLIFITIGIALNIVINILFHIGYSIGIAVKEQGQNDKQIERIISSSTVEDEMDKLINYKSARYGYICSGVGFISSLIFLATGGSAFITLHLIFGSFFAASFVEGVVNIYCYEKGIANG